MSSASSQNVEKKHAKPFDFKWFQRGAKHPASALLPADAGSRPAGTSESRGSRASSRSHSRGPSFGLITSSASMSRRSSTRASSGSRGFPRSESRSDSRGESRSRSGSRASLGSSPDGGPGPGPGPGPAAASGSAEALRRKLDRLLLGDHPKAGPDLAANSIPFPARTPRPSMSRESSLDQARLLDQTRHGDPPRHGDPLRHHEQPRRASRSDHYHPRSLLQETQDFLSRRRKTDESRSRSRSSSIVASMRRASEASAYTVPLGPAATPDAGKGSGSPRHSTVGGSESDSGASGAGGGSALGSDGDPAVWLKRVLPLPPPPTIGLGSVLEDRDVQALRLDPMAVRYADHMHALGYAQNRYVCAMLAEQSRPAEGRRYNGMVMQAFIMRMLRFHGEPLDMSLRKFLFHVALPQESQQIERVLHSFGVLWAYHNPGLFVDEEQVLCAVFSLLMLHTDAFNRNVKRKISKHDYVRNATLDNIAPEIFGYFYDNITAAPFKADDDVPSASSPSWLLSEPPTSSSDLGPGPDHQGAPHQGASHPAASHQGAPHGASHHGSSYPHGSSSHHGSSHQASSSSRHGSFSHHGSSCQRPHSTVSASGASSLRSLSVGARSPRAGSPSVRPVSVGSSPTDDLPFVTPSSSRGGDEPLQPLASPLLRTADSGDETAVPDPEVTLSISPATPDRSHPFSALAAHTPSPNTPGAHGSAASTSLNLPLPPAPSTPVGTAPSNPPSTTFGSISEDTNSLGSRRSSSFTWLRNQPLDPYPYLLENRLDALRPELSGVPDIPELDTKDFTCTADLEAVRSQLSAQQTDTLQIVLPKSRPEVYMEGPSDQKLEAQTRPGVVAVEIVKYGIVLRREWKRTFVGQRPGWREWGALLTNSRLYLFKNASIVRQLKANSAGTNENAETTTSIETLQTASVLSMSNIAAVVVTNLPQEDNLLLFMLVESGGRAPTQHYFAVRTEQELKEWVQMINVVATQATLQVSVEPLSVPAEITRAQAKVDEQIDVTQARIDSLAMNLRHFQRLAPLHQRTREALVFTAGGYSSKCEDAYAELTRLRAYENVLKFALESCKKNHS